MEQLLHEITVQYLYNLMIIFARIGATLMLFPGIGEAYVNPRARLTLGFLLAIITQPLLKEYLPIYQEGNSILIFTLSIEILIGIFYGVIARMIINVTQIFGTIVSSQSALGSAMLFDPNQGAQGAIISNFYSILVLILLFTTNIYFEIIKAVIASYQLHQPGNTPFLEDFANISTTTINQIFIIAFKLSSPIIIINLLILIGGGILSRLMPGMQVFFILTPAQIILTFIIIMVTLIPSLRWLVEKIHSLIINIYGI